MFEFSRFVMDELTARPTIKLDAGEEYGGPSEFVLDTMGMVMDSMSIDERIRMDDTNTLFFARQLESIEARVFRVKRRELKAARLIPVSNRDPAGSATITYYLFDKTGIARIIANPTDEIPRADAFATRHTVDVFVSASSFAWTTRDLRQAAIANVAIETEKADAARRAMAEKRSEIAWTGDPDTTLLGFINNPNVSEEEVALNQAASSRLWVDKTAQEIIDDVNSLPSSIRQDSREVHSGPYTLILPIEQHEIIRNKRITDNFPTKTVRQYLLDESDNNGIVEIEAVPELAGTGTGTTDQMIIYEKDDENLEQRIPMPMIMHPPERRGLEFIVILEEELAARGWTPPKFAEMIGYSILEVTQIISGERVIDVAIAGKLSRAIGNSSQFWLNLESSYRRNLAAQR